MSKKRCINKGCAFNEIEVDPQGQTTCLSCEHDLEDLGIDWDLLSGLFSSGLGKPGDLFGKRKP